MTISRRAGFTLIEIMIALTIMAFMMATIVPLLSYRPGYERKKFIAHLQSVAQFAWQRAIITHQVHRIVFNIKERRAFTEYSTTHSARDKLTFEPVKDSLASFSWDNSIVIRQFIIEGFDEMKRSVGRNTETIWFYIIPDGMTQQVTINGLDKEDMINGKARSFGLVLNPFTAQFKEYDTFQK